jgi:hypothetical protein
MGFFDRFFNEAASAVSVVPEQEIDLNIIRDSKLLNEIDQFHAMIDVKAFMQEGGHYLNSTEGANGVILYADSEQDIRISPENMRFLAKSGGFYSVVEANGQTGEIKVDGTRLSDLDPPVQADFIKAYGEVAEALGVSVKTPNVAYAPDISAEDAMEELGSKSTIQPVKFDM